MLVLAAVAVWKHLGGVSLLWSHTSYSVMWFRSKWLNKSVMLSLAAETVYPECLHLIAFCSMSSSLKPQRVQKTDMALFWNTSRSDQRLFVGSVFSLKTSLSPDSLWVEAGMGWRHVTEHNVSNRIYIIYLWNDTFPVNCPDQILTGGLDWIPHDPRKVIVGPLAASNETLAVTVSFHT